MSCNFRASRLLKSKIKVNVNDCLRASVNQGEILLKFWIWLFLLRCTNVKVLFSTKLLIMTFETRRHNVKVDGWLRNNRSRPFWEADGEAGVCPFCSAHLWILTTPSFPVCLLETMECVCLLEKALLLSRKTDIACRLCQSQGTDSGSKRCLMPHPCLCILF